MKIALFASDIVWESPQLNLNTNTIVLDKFFKDFNSGIDLLVLPEFFTTGFSMNSSLAQEMNGESVRWLKLSALKYKTTIISSLPIIDNNNLYNRAIITNGVDLHFYNKRHLFSYGGEDSLFTKGDSKSIFNLNGVNISTQVCYDLRFPVWARNVNLSYDVMVNIANWPSSRISVVEPLVKARAIENQSFFFFLNRSGSDPQNIYNGDRVAVDYFGKDILPIYDSGNIGVYQLDLTLLKTYRERFRAWQDAEKFSIY